jgi:hypothetical protein
MPEGDAHYEILMEDMIVLKPYTILKASRRVKKIRPAPQKEAGLIV